MTVFYYLITVRILYLCYLSSLFILFLPKSKLSFIFFWFNGKVPSTDCSLSKLLGTNPWTSCSPCFGGSILFLCLPCPRRLLFWFMVLMYWFLAFLLLFLTLFGP